MKIHFTNIFKVYPDGSIEPLRPVMISGVQLGPGVRFTQGVSFGGVDLSLYTQKDLEIENSGGVVVIKGIY